MTEHQPAAADLRALRTGLRGADDEKIMRIVALLDEAHRLPVPETILATLRSRLTALRPPHPLRFGRLLFVPLNDLIVDPLGWQPGQPVIPRNIITSIALSVRRALGPEAEAIEQMITGHDTHATQVVTEAGKLLWPRAGTLLAALPVTAEWTTLTGLPIAHYHSFAQAIATVLCRAVQLHRLTQDAQLGALAPCEQTLREIVRGLAGEPPEGCAMVVKLLLGCVPDPGLMSRMLTSGNASREEHTRLKTAIDLGVDGFLKRIDSGSELMNRLRNGPIAAVGNEVRRINQLLKEIAEQPDAARHHARLKSIRASLDDICRSRFDEEMRQKLMAPLAAAAGPVEGTTQRDLEECARQLRTLEATGRKIGSGAAYDNLLKQAGNALQGAAQSGRLTPGRQLRLVEILAGPDAAEALYRQYELRECPLAQS